MVEANLVTLNNEAGLKFIPELVARKIAGAEQSVLDDADVSFHESQYQSLRAELETAFQQSALPELPDEETRRALNGLLTRVRLQGLAESHGQSN